MPTWTKHQRKVSPENIELWISLLLCPHRSLTRERFTMVDFSIKLAPSTWSGGKAAKKANPEHRLLNIIIQARIMDVGGAEAKNHKHAPATTVIRSENVCGEINPFDNISLKLFCPLPRDNRLLWFMKRNFHGVFPRRRQFSPPEWWWWTQCV